MNPASPARKRPVTRVGPSEPTRSRDAPQPHGLLDIMGYVRGRGHRFRTFWARVFWKADEDNIFFMAGAIAFNVVVAVVPLVLLVVGIGGYVASARWLDPGQTIAELLVAALPDLAGAPDLVAGVPSLIDGVLSGRRQLSLVGGVLLIWLSTRLVGTLRTALREVFDIARGRDIIQGKIFDAQMVVVGGVLFLVNAGITVAVKAARDYGVSLLGLEGRAVAWGDRLLALALAFASIWVLYLLIYRFLPARRIPWRTALIAATVMAVTYEIMKHGFSWYATSVADYSTTYGNLATLAVLFFWVYYTSIAFVLAGEIAQVATMRRAWKSRPVVAGGATAEVDPPNGSTKTGRWMGR